MSVPDKAMKLKDGKILYDNLRSMVAVNFDQTTANDAGSYVCYQGAVYLLPSGHTAGTTWANTTKVGPTNIGSELSNQKSALQVEKSIISEITSEEYSVLFGTVTEKKAINYNAEIIDASNGWNIYTCFCRGLVQN